MIVTHTFGKHTGKVEIADISHTNDSASYKQKYDNEGKVISYTDLGNILYIKKHEKNNFIIFPRSVDVVQRNTTGYMYGGPIRKGYFNCFFYGHMTFDDVDPDLTIYRMDLHTFEETEVWHEKLVLGKFKFFLYREDFGAEIPIYLTQLNENYFLLGISCDNDKNYVTGEYGYPYCRFEKFILIDIEENKSWPVPMKTKSDAFLWDVDMFFMYTDENSTYISFDTPHADTWRKEHFGEKHSDAIFLFTLEEFVNVCKGLSDVNDYVIESIGINGGIDHHGMNGEHLLYKLTTFPDETNSVIKYTISTRQKELVRTYPYIPYAARRFAVPTIIADNPEGQT